MQFQSVQQTIQAWIKADGCAAEPATTVLPSTVRDDLAATQKTYNHGRDGTEVVLVEVAGGGHTWPGRPPIVWFTGKSVKGVSATDLMWDFFQRHPMP